MIRFTAQLKSAVPVILNALTPLNLITCPLSPESPHKVFMSSNCK